MMQKGWSLGVFAAAFTLTLAAHAGSVRSDNQSIYRPTGKGYGELDDSPGAAQRAGKGGGARKTTSNGISYHGGPVMTNASGVNVYYIWYGNWSGNSAPNILTTLANGLSGSPYFNINTTYTDGSGNRVVNQVNLSTNQITDSYSQGTALSDAGVQAVVAKAIGNGVPDPNGVYFVLTSSDVNETSGFCTQYCGWHNKASINGATIKYAFVGNPDRCPSACAAQTTSPNGNAGADGMASIVAHELEEAASDPELNAWYDNRGYENADKCAWTFGTEYTTANGAKANMNLGGLDFLIQQNWVNASGGYCSLKF